MGRGRRQGPAGAAAGRLLLSERGAPPRTPDGRYIVVRGRLWRTSNPHLGEDERARLVAELMSARRAVREAGGDPAALKAARARVQAAKVALGERGDPWWSDGTRDWNRYLAKNTPYAAWWAEQAGK